MVSEVEVEGIADINRKLKDLPTKLVIAALRNSMKSVAREVSIATANSVPVRTGQLKTSITPSSRVKLDKTGVIWGSVKGLFYARFLATGTKFMEPKFNADSIIEREKDTVLKMFIDALNEKIAKQYKKYSKGKIS